MMTTARLAGVAAAVVAILTGVLWLPQTRDAVVQQASQAVSGLALSPADGSLMTGVTFESVTYIAPGQAVAAQDVRVRLTPWGGLTGAGWLAADAKRVQVERFSAEGGVTPPTGSLLLPGRFHIERLELQPSVLPETNLLPAGGLTVQQVLVFPDAGGLTARGEVVGPTGTSPVRVSANRAADAAVPEFSLHADDLSAFVAAPWTQTIRGAELTVTGRGAALDAMTAEAVVSLSPSADTPSGSVRAKLDGQKVTFSGDGVAGGTQLAGRGHAEFAGTSSWTLVLTLDAERQASGVVGTLTFEGASSAESAEFAWRGRGKLMGEPWSVANGTLQIDDGWEAAASASYDGWTADLTAGGHQASTIDFAADARSERGVVSLSGTSSGGTSPTFGVQAEWRDARTGGAFEAQGRVKADEDAWLLDQLLATAAYGDATLQVAATEPVAFGAQWSGSLQGAVQLPGQAPERFELHLSEHSNGPSVQAFIGGTTLEWSRGPSGRWVGSLPAGGLSLFGVTVNAVEDVTWEVGGWPSGAFTAGLNGTSDSLGDWQVNLTAPQAGGSDAVWTLSLRLSGDEGEPLEAELSVGPRQPGGTIPLELNGTLEGEGDLRFSAESWTLSLSGPQLQVNAEGRNWLVEIVRVTVDEARLRLDPWLARPEADGTVISLAVEGVRTGDVWAWQPGSWAFEIGALGAEGVFRLTNEGVQVEGRVAAEFDALVPTSGRLPIEGVFTAAWRGGEDWRSAVLEGSLSGRMEDDGVSGVSWLAEGDVRLAGTLGAPQTDARVELTGDVDGVLTYAGALNGRTQGRVTADVAWQGRTASFDVDLDRSSEGDVGQIVTEGGRWQLKQDGARIVVQRDETGDAVANVRLGERWLDASATGRFGASGVASGVTGEVAWSLPSLLPLQVQARWEDAVVGGVPLPELTWSGGLAGGTLTSSLGGSVDAEWDLARSYLSLRGQDLALGALGTYGIVGAFNNGAAEGTLTADRGAWSAVVEGRWTNGSWSAVAITQTPNPLTLEASGGNGRVLGSLAGTATVAGQDWTFTPSVGGTTAGIETQASGPAGDFLVRVDWPGGWNAPTAQVTTSDGVDLFLLTPEGDTTGDGGLHIRYDALWGGDAWSISGSTMLNAFGRELNVEGVTSSEVPALTVSLPSVVRAKVSLRNGGLVSSLNAAIREGLIAEVDGAFQGEVRWSQKGGIQSDRLVGSLAGVDIHLEGGGTLDEVDIRGTLNAAGGATPFGPYARFVLGADDVSLRALGSVSNGTLVMNAAASADASPFGSARWSLPEQTVTARFERSALVVDASYHPTRGWTGRLEADGARVPVPGLEPTPVNASLRLEDGLLRGSFQAVSGGSFVGTGQVDVPFVLGTSDRADRSDFQVSLASYDVRALPSVPIFAPSLRGVVEARLQLRSGQLLAEVNAPELRTPNGPLPVRLQVSGPFATALDRAGVNGTVGGSNVTGWIDRDEASIWVALERFPLERLIAARYGLVDAEATAVGVLHAQVPWSDTAQASVRLATESLTVQRGSRVAEGVMTVDVTPDRADFDVRLEGQGRWAADGFVSREGIDVRLEVNGSDATPFLGLVPALAAAGVSADGSLNVQATGSLNQPRILVGISDLRLGAYGGRYRVRNTSLRWLEGNLVVDGFVEGLDPLGGSLRVLGRGTVPSWVEGLTAGGFTLNGSIDIPLFGALTNLNARIEASEDGTQRLSGQGDLGRPLRLSGTVRPFNLRIEGEGVDLSSTPLRLADTRGAVAATLSWDQGLVLGGRFTVQQGRYEIVQDEGVMPEQAADGSSGAAPLRFDSISIDVREAQLDESFATGTFSGDLRLSGSSNAPRLQGSLAARQAQLVLFGRAFDASQAEVLFEPSRGVLPILNVAASRTYRKRDALANTPPSVTIDQPPGATFDVDLAFSTEVVTDSDGALRLDVAPTLSSEALLRVDDPDAGTFLTRSLSDGELVTLVSVGRLDPIAASSEGGLAESVASTTLEGTFETLVLRELSGALAEATGLPSLAIETTSLGSSLTDSEPFGVSLRIGGALEEGLFASYEVERTFSAEEALTGTTNRFELAYDLDPLSFDAATSVTIPSLAGEPATVGLSSAANYRVTDWTSISIGAELEQGEQRASFGVSFRW